MSSGGYRCNLAEDPLVSAVDDQSEGACLKWNHSHHVLFRQAELHCSSGGEFRFRFLPRALAGDDDAPAVVQVELDLSTFNISFSDYLAEFVSGFLCRNRRWGQSPIGLGQDAEDLLCAFDLQNVHEPYWESVIPSNDPVYLDFAGVYDPDCLFGCSSES